MSQLLFEYPYSALATGILDIEQFTNELATLLEEEPSQGEEAWKQVEFLYHEIGLRQVERDHLFKLIAHYTGFSKSALKLVSKPVQHTTKQAIDTFNRLPQTLSNADHNETTQIVNHSLVNTPKPQTHVDSGQSMNSHSSVLNSPQPHPSTNTKPTFVRRATTGNETPYSHNSASNGTSKIVPTKESPKDTDEAYKIPAAVLFQTNNPIPEHASPTIKTDTPQPAPEQETIINQYAAVHQTAAIMPDKSGTAMLNQKETTTTPYSKITDPSITEAQNSRKSLWQHSLYVIFGFPWHIILPVALLFGLVGTLAFQNFHTQYLNSDAEIRLGSQTLTAEAPPETSTTNLFTKKGASIQTTSKTLSGTLDSTSGKNLESPIESFFSPQAIEELYSALTQAIADKKIGPYDKPDTASSLLESMILSDASSPLTRQGRIAVAQAYLQLAKAARHNDKWEQAEHHVERAIHIRKANTLPSGLPNRP